MAIEGALIRSACQLGKAQFSKALAKVLLDERDNSPAARF